MIRLLAILLSFVLLPASLSTTLPSAAKPTVNAAGYALVEAEDLYVISSFCENERLSPASTTKIMTALVAIENTRPDEIVTVSEKAAGTEGSSAYLRKGEKLSVKDLLYCLMLQSANDAATALAEHIAGSEEAFALLMNEKAAKLGLKNTHFENPHGLDASTHRTSAYDLAALTAAALRNTVFAGIVSTKSITVGQEENARRLTNHNRLLFSLDGCIGVKTGYTIASGRCLVSACVKNGTTLICVTLGCRDDWEAHRALYAYGFQKVRRFGVSDFSLCLPLAGAKEQSVTLRAEDYSFLSSPDARFSYEICCPHFLFPPIERGEKAGELILKSDGREIVRLALKAEEEIKETEKPGFFKKLLRQLFSLFVKHDK